MSRIFWDTNLFIYHIEGPEGEQTLVADLFERMIERGDQLLTSTLTLGEVLVRPIGLGLTALARQYEQLIETLGPNLIPFDLAAAHIYGQIRQDKSVRAPDAIQLACAATAKADVFITNDARLSRKNIPGIDFIVPLDRVYL